MLSSVERCTGLGEHLDKVIARTAFCCTARMSLGSSLVLSSRHRIGLRVLARSGQVAVSIDGQLSGVLDPGDWVTVYGGRQRAQLVRLDEPHFLDRVRDRFGLADSRAAVADKTARRSHTQGAAALDPVNSGGGDPRPVSAAAVRAPPPVAGA